MTISRRAFMCSAVAVAGAAIVPAPALPAIVRPEWEAVELLKPAWIVGTEDEFDAQVIRAFSADEAVRIVAEEYSGVSQCVCNEIENKELVDQCDFCWKKHSLDSWRAESFDRIADPSPGDWVRAGFGYHCSRCGYETFGQDNGQGVNDEAVCGECMTLADWDIVDPERAAELREDT